MPYTTNPHMPRVRMEAVKLVRAGWSYRKVARHTGFSIGAIASWVKKAEPLGHNNLWIPTENSRPKRHPRALSPEVIRVIIEERLKTKRCAEVVHQQVLEIGRAHV